MEKLIGVALFTASGISLPAYLFVLQGEISLAGERSSNNVNMTLEIVMVLFIIATATYLITYILSLIFFIRKMDKKFLWKQ